MTAPSESRTQSTGTRLTRYLWLVWIVWLTFLAYPLGAFFGGHPTPLRIGIVLSAVALFVATYFWNVWFSAWSLWHEPNQVSPVPRLSSPWILPSILLAIALALTWFDRPDWYELFIYVSVSMAPALSTRRAVQAVIGVVLLGVVLGFAFGIGLGNTAAAAFEGAGSGFAVIIVVRAIVVERELRDAREEIARLAVNEERLRFARDLHDLLGHSLSLIALKSELAGRLVSVAPARATGEIHDIEEVARQALLEVRDAVAGYRLPTLASELTSARELLAAAGITYRSEGMVDHLPVTVDAVLGWAVREGVTNVIRHSRAQNCILRIAGDDNQVNLEIVDDGCAQPEASRPPGSGLAGLTERVAALDGHCAAATVASGGFRLAVQVPVGRDTSNSNRGDVTPHYDAVGLS